MAQYDVRYTVEKKNRFDIFGFFSPVPITEDEAKKAAGELAKEHGMTYVSHRIENGELIVRMEK